MYLHRGGILPFRNVMEIMNGNGSYKTVIAGGSIPWQSPAPVTRAIAETFVQFRRAGFTPPHQSMAG
jgi:hypothetical protein